MCQKNAKRKNYLTKKEIDNLKRLNFDIKSPK